MREIKRGWVQEEGERLDLGIFGGEWHFREPKGFSFQVAQVERGEDRGNDRSE